MTISCEMISDELAMMNAAIQNLEITNNQNIYNQTLVTIQNVLGKQPDNKLAVQALANANDNSLRINQLRNENQPLQVTVADDKITIKKNNEISTVFIQTNQGIERLKTENQKLTQQLKQLEQQAKQLQQQIKTVERTPIPTTNTSGLATKQELNNLRNQLTQQNYQSASNNQSNFDFMRDRLDKTRQLLDDVIGIDDDRPNKFTDDLNIKLQLEIKRRESEDFKLWQELKLVKADIEANKKKLAEQEAKDKIQLAKLESFFTKVGANTAAIATNAKAIAATKIELALFKKAYAAFIAGLPAFIKGLFWSFVASAAFNTAIAGIFGDRTKADAEARNIANDAFKEALKAKKIAVDNQTEITKIEEKIGKNRKDINKNYGFLFDARKYVDENFGLHNTRLSKLENAIKEISIPDIKKLPNLIPKIEGLGKEVLKIGAQLLALTVIVKGLQIITKPLINGNINNVTYQQNTYVTNNYDQRKTTNNNIVQGQDLGWLRTQLNRIENTGKLNLTLNGVMNNKMGAQIKDGLSGWMSRFSKWDILNRLMSMMTLAATIHNAQMLSNNLFTTLISSMQNVVNFFELKDSEGKGYDVNVLIKTSIENALKNILGESAYNNLSTGWKNANKIYQSTGNLLNSMMNFGDVVTQALQLVTGQTSKIGNALRIWGTVGEAAFGWMNPNPNFNNPILMKLNNLNETASIVEEVSQQPQNVKDAKTEVETNAAQLAKDVAQGQGFVKGLEFGEAAEVKEQQESKKANSKGKDMENSDLEADE